MQVRNLLIVVAAALIIAGLFLVFPIYQVQNVGDTSVVLQHNRLTGEAYILSSRQNWEKVEHPQENQPSSPEENLPEEVESKLKGWGGLNGNTLQKDQTSFSGTLYNGSRWNLSGLQIGLVALDVQRDTVWYRSYADDIEVKPHSTGSFSFEVMTGAQFDKVNWHIISAWGKEAEEFGDLR